MNDRVLVVDDSEYVRELIRARLEPAFEVVAEAADGAEAVDVYREVRPDAVTMDFALPKLDGPRATAAIKEEDPDAVVVFCTCVTQQEQLKRAVVAGAADYVEKPFDAEEPAAALRAAIDDADRDDPGHSNTGHADADRNDAGRDGAAPDGI